MTPPRHAGALITGMGAVSAIGLGIPAMRASLRAARSGIAEITAFSTEGLAIHHAACVPGLQPADHFQPRPGGGWPDRTAQLALLAAREAVADAGLAPAVLASSRVGLVMGICAGGIGDGGMPLRHDAPLSPAEARAQAQRCFDTAHHQQTRAVALDLGLTGPRLTVSTACATSTSAMAAALTLIESGLVDAVLVGGADAFSLSIYAGFYSLGAMAPQPTSPFSTALGATFGEGAGCLVLESAERRISRKAPVHGVLLAVGSSSDAHHVTAPHPAGEGLRRAMQLAIEGGGLIEAGIDYVNAHGTGTLDNDIAETLAIQRVFERLPAPPPVSASKSYFGHTLGGAGALEFIASLIGMQDGFLPATLQFSEARPGCALDCVPNRVRPGRIGAFLCNSAAFGGVNAVALGARPGTAQPLLPPAQPVQVTGIGLVTPVGLGHEAFRTALLHGHDGIAPIARFDTRGARCRIAALVPEFAPRKVAPTVDMRRMDLFTRYAVVATSLALKDARLSRIAPERIGLFVAMTRGPVSTQDAFQQSLARDGIAALSARLFPAIVLATVSGQIAQACQIKGASFTVAEGPGAGLHALAHASLYLGLHPELDAMVVVAADEIGSLVQASFDRLGLLEADPAAHNIHHPQAAGMVLGEGAAALVLERRADAAGRAATPWGSVAGIGLGSEPREDEMLDPDGNSLEAAARRALDQAGGPPPDLLLGMARGARRHDQREANAMRRLLAGRDSPVLCLNGQLGVAEAAGSLFAASAALLAMRHGEAYAGLRNDHAPADLPLQRGSARSGHYRRALLMAGSDCGNNAAVLLDGEGAP